MKKRIMMTSVLVLGILFGGTFTESRAQVQDESAALARAAAFALAEVAGEEAGLAEDAVILISEYAVIPIPKLPTSSQPSLGPHSGTKHVQATLQHVARELGARVMVPNQGLKCEGDKVCHIEDGTMVVSLSGLRVDGASAEVTVDVLFESSTARTGVERINFDVRMDLGQVGWVPREAVVRLIS